MIEKFALIAKEDEMSSQVALEIEKRLVEKGKIKDQGHPQLVISVGGDGTMLYAIHTYEDQLDDIYFLGIHTGTLGFYTDYQKCEIDLLIEDICQGHYEITNRSLIDITVYGNTTEHAIALNEFRLTNAYVTQVLRVYINGEYLETFRGSGLCVSTPSGSTAYNKSLNGAVVLPNIEVIQLSEIASIGHNAYRSLGSSLILDKNAEIVFTIDRDHGLVLGLDHINLDIKDVKKIRITGSKHYVKCIQYRPFSFISRIRRAFISG